MAHTLTVTLLLLPALQMESLQPWSVARGRKGKTMRKFGVDEKITDPHSKYNNPEQINEEMKSSNSEILNQSASFPQISKKRNNDDISKALFVDDLESQLRMKFGDGGFHERQFKLNLDEFPSFEAEAEIKDTFLTISQRFEDIFGT